MKKEEKYLKVLNSVIDEEQSREWMQKPFNAGDKTMATNGWIMVATPKVGEYTDRSSKVGFVYPYVKTMDLPITIESLRNIISQVPMIDGVIDCDCCNGTGEVDYEFYYKCKMYSQEVNCPICDGDGFIPSDTAEKVVDPEKQIEINNYAFNVNRIIELIEIADTLEVDTVFLVRQNADYGANIFKAGEVDVIIMPAMKGLEQNIYRLPF